MTTTDTIFSHLVAPMFCAFRHKYPEITLDFVIDNRAGAGQMIGAELAALCLRRVEAYRRG